MEDIVTPEDSYLCLITYILNKTSHKESFINFAGIIHICHENSLNWYLLQFHNLGSDMEDVTRKGAIHEVLLGSLRHKVRGVGLQQDPVHVKIPYDLVNIAGIVVGDHPCEPQLALGVSGDPHLGSLQVRTK